MRLIKDPINQPSTGVLQGTGKGQLSPQGLALLGTARASGERLGPNPPPSVL